MSRYAASQAEKISHIRVTVLTKTVCNEFNSVMYVVRRLATHLIRDSKIVIKSHFQNSTIEKFVRHFIV